MRALSIFPILARQSLRSCGAREVIGKHRRRSPARIHHLLEVPAGNAFQLGVSGASELEVSSTCELSCPLSFADYGAEANSYIEQGTQITNGADTTGVAFVLIPPSKVTRINDRSVRYTLVIDDEMANDTTNPLNEVGLFMKNPTGSVGQTKSILVAYRTFSDIAKTSDFSLVFRWTLNL